jgi:hypothetical protein
MTLLKKGIVVANLRRFSGHRSLELIRADMSGLREQRGASLTLVYFGETKNLHLRHKCSECLRPGS